MVRGYRISNDKRELDFSLIYKFISNSYWAKRMPKSVLEKAIQHSLCFGVFTDEGGQVGFGRVITDYATFAYLSDVFIVEAHRGKGLSKWLVSEIIAQPELQNLRRFVLVTKDAHSLYEQFGFKSLAAPDRYMEIWDPDVYQKIT